MKKEKGQANTDGRKSKNERIESFLLQRYDFRFNVVKSKLEFRRKETDYTYLDNDEAGRKVTELIKLVCQSVNDRSEKYAGFKDLNDYLCQKPMTKSEVKKIKRGIKI